MSGNDGLAKGWAWSDLETVCAKITDGTHHSPRREMQTRSGDFLYVTAKNIKEWGIDLSDVTCIPEAIHRPVYDRCDPQQGDVLYIKDGVTTGIATVNQLDDEFSLLSSVALLKPRHHVIDSRFLKWYLNSPDGYRSMTSQMGGTAIKRLTIQKIKAGKVLIAPLPEQHRIVAKIEELFSDLDAGVAALERAKANLKRYRAAVLKAAVEGRLTEQWRAEHSDVEPASVLLDRILAERRRRWEQDQLAKYEAKGTKPPKNWKDKYKPPAEPDTENLPPLPAGWCWVTVDLLIVESLRNGISVKGSDSPPGIPALKLSAMSQQGFDYTDVRYIPISEQEAAANEVREDDFYVSRGNGSLSLVVRGTHAQEPPFQVVFPDTMIRLRLASPIRSTGWLWTVWSGRFFRSQIEQRAKTSAGIYKVSQPQLASIVVPLPPHAEQQAAVAEIARHLSIIRTSEILIDANLRRSARLRQSILKRAFEGKLVPQDPADEPAEELLARIRGEDETQLSSTGSKGKRRRTRTKEDATT